MVNLGTPDDPRAVELDEHFRSHVISANHDDADLYVNDNGEDPQAAADAVDGIEYNRGETSHFGGFYFDFVPVETETVEIGNKTIEVRDTGEEYEVEVIDDGPAGVAWWQRGVDPTFTDHTERMVDAGVDFYVMTTDEYVRRYENTLPKWERRGGIVCVFPTEEDVEAARGVGVSIATSNL